MNRSSRYIMPAMYVEHIEGALRCCATRQTIGKPTRLPCSLCTHNRLSCGTRKAMRSGMALRSSTNFRSSTQYLSCPKRNSRELPVGSSWTMRRSVQDAHLRALSSEHNVAHLSHGKRPHLKRPAAATAIITRRLHGPSPSTSRLRQCNLSLG